MAMKLAIGMFDYDLPLDEAIGRVRSLAVSHVELVAPRNVTLENVNDVKERLDASGISVTAVATLTKPNMVDDWSEVSNTIQLLSDSVRIAARLGAERAITYFGGHPTRQHDEAIERYVELVGPALTVAEGEGVDILIENHFSHAPGEVTNTAGGCLELVGAVDHPQFAVNFDPCNFAVGGQDLGEAYEVLRNVIRNVHMKDTVPFDVVIHADYPGRVVTDLEQGDFIFVAMGDGITDNASVLARLAKDGYDGPVSVEAHTPQYTLDDVFAVGRDFCLAHGVEL